MNVRELKDKILNKEVSSRLLILECPENFFVADQYINQIANDKNRELVYVDNLTNDLFESNNLYVYTCDNFDENIDTSITNYIIRCKSCDRSDLNEYIVTIPKLENWQIQNYAKYNLKGISDEAILWLCKICNNDIYKIDNEINKLKVFDQSDRELVFNQYNLNNGYSYLTDFNIFTLSNSLIRKDIDTLSEVLESIDFIDIEPFALINTLIKGFSNVIKVQLSNGICPQGMTDKQFYAISKNNVNIYSIDKLEKIYSFLNSLDMKIKTGKLPVDNIIDYIVLNIVGD